jgi:manganese transport protein
LINNKNDMGHNKAGIILNIGLFCALIFSCFIVYNGIIALNELF